MPARITLTATRGALNGQRFVFGQRTSTILGRASDCYPRMDSTYENMNVSRHHCQLDVDPPLVRVRDLGSRNGTFVNGQAIGHRARNQDAQAAAGLRWKVVDLHDGDELALGGSVFRVAVALPLGLDGEDTEGEDK